jgi:hypothetical protein
MKTLLGLIGLLSLGACTFTTPPPQTTTIVEKPAPTQPVVVQPQVVQPPAYGSVWVPGYYTNDGLWINGHYETRFIH